MDENKIDSLAELRELSAETTFSNLATYYRKSFDSERKETIKYFVNEHGELLSYTSRDPVTTATVIVTIGEALIKLFKSGVDGLIKEALNGIKDELNYIKNILQDVEKALEQLEVLIEHQNVDAAINRLIATTSVCSEHLDEWESIINGQDEALKFEIRKEIRSFLLDLQRDSITCMLYGYASYNSVALTLMYEIELLDLGGASNATKRSSITRYNKFFNYLLDPNVKGTISNRRQITEEEIQNLENANTPINQQNVFVGRASWRCGAGCDVFQSLSGDINNGYSGSITWGNIIPPDCPHGGGPHSPIGESISPRTAYDFNEGMKPFYDNLNNFLVNHNTAVARRKELVQKSTSLKAAEAYIGEMFNKTNEMLAKIP